VRGVWTAMDVVRLPPLLFPSLPPHLMPVLAGARHAFDLACFERGRQPLSQCVGVGLRSEGSFPLRLCIALRCVARDTETRTVFLISITTQCHATIRTAAVMEISL